MQPDIRYLYRRLRAGSRQHWPATLALALAREDAILPFDKRRKDFDDTPAEASEPFKVGSDTMRRYVCAGKFGFRYMGDSDSLAGRRIIDHNGWYTDCFQESVAIGCVFLLPARGGKTPVFTGFRIASRSGDKYQLDDAVYLTAKPFEWLDGTEDVDGDTLDLSDAAKDSDQIAEIYARDSREYDQAFQAGGRWADLYTEIRQLRKRRRKLSASLRHGRNDETATALLKQEVENCRIMSKHAYDDARELADGDEEEYWFSTSDETHRAAFCDGAGITKFPE